MPEYSQNNLSIKGNLNENGFGFDFLSRKLSVKYSLPVFKNFIGGDAVVDNYLYALFAHVRLLSPAAIKFGGSMVVGRSLVDFGVEHDLPRVAYITKTKFHHWQEKWRQNYHKYVFSSDRARILPVRPNDHQAAVLAMSFGKDSLLCYALLRELGVRVHPVFVCDESLKKYHPVEYRSKMAVLKKFVKQEKIAVDTITDNTDDVFLSLAVGAQNREWSMGTNSALVYALEILPVNIYYGAHWLAFGNEQSFNDYVLNNVGEKIYPSFDQTGVFMKKENQMLKKLTSQQIQLFSPIEPFYNLAEVALLYHRYPHLIKYWMSCDSDRLKFGRGCGQCCACAQNYLYAVAVGGDPCALGLNNNDIFQRKNAKYFVLFSRIHNPYDMTKSLRDEQLLAFYLAEKRGAKGALIDLFKAKFDREAQARYKVLRSKYFGFHCAVTVPPQFKNKLKKIASECFCKFYE